MANNTRLVGIATKIGTVAGRADRTAHKAARAAVEAKKELSALVGRMEEIAQDLKQTSKRLRQALR
jgi:hypothetical protein